MAALCCEYRIFRLDAHEIGGHYKIEFGLPHFHVLNRHHLMLFFFFIGLLKILVLQVELERLRLLCERLIKREKLKVFVELIIYIFLTSYADYLFCTVRKWLKNILIFLRYAAGIGSLLA